MKTHTRYAVVKVDGKRESCLVASPSFDVGFRELEEFARLFPESSWRLERRAGWDKPIIKEIATRNATR